MVLAWDAVAVSLAVTVPARVSTALLLSARLAAVSLSDAKLSEVLIVPSRLLASATLTLPLTATVPAPLMETPLRIDGLLVRVAPPSTLMLSVPKSPVKVPPLPLTVPVFVPLTLMPLRLALRV